VHRHLVVLALVVASAASVACATGASASSTTPSNSLGIRLIPISGAGVNDTLAKSYIVERLAPGATTNREVEIENDSPGEMNISVYAGAARVSDGSFAFTPRGTTNDLTTWTSIEQGTIHLAPHTKALDTVTIVVPRTATTGERYAVVWAEVTGTPAPHSSVTLVNRVGIRIYLSVGAGGDPPAHFSMSSLRATRSSAGEPSITSSVRNTGLTTLELGGHLTLTGGPDGLRDGPIGVSLTNTLAPGASAPVVVTLDTALPRGPWRATLVLSSGSVTHSVTATITFPATSSTSRNALVLLVVLLALALLAAVFWWLRRRRRSHATQ
jgi:hypothetical protein